MTSFRLFHMEKSTAYSEVWGTAPIYRMFSLPFAPTYGSLPQGAVTSPALSNIVCIRLDRRIAGYAGKHNIDYTRYADDMTLSSTNHLRLVRAKRMVERIVVEEGFQLNQKKTRFKGPGSQRRITGLVISDDSVGIGRKQKRVIRAKIHRLVTGSLSGDDYRELQLHIQGWLAFLHDVDKCGYDQLNKYAVQLAGKHGVANLVL